MSTNQIATEHQIEYDYKSIVGEKIQLHDKI